MTPALTHLPDNSRKQIDVAVTAAKSGLGEALEAVLLIGAAVRPDRPDRARHPELLLIVEALPVESITALAEAMHPSVSKGLRFRTITTEELHGSLDVYALEIAEWISHHILLFGADPLLELAPSPAHLRHELERSLRGIERRVRNRVLQGMAAHTRDLDPVFAEAFTHLLVAAHHALALADQTPPGLERDLLKAFARWLALEPGPVVELFSRLRERRRGTNKAGSLQELACLTEILGAACRKVDTLKVDA